MTSPQLSREQQDRAESLYETSLIVDTLSGHIVAPEPPPVDGKLYLDRLLESKIRAVNLTLAAHSDDFETALEHMFHYYNLFQVATDRVIQVKTVADIEKAQAENKVGVIFGFQSPTPIGDHFYRWTIFHKLGLRICQLAYMERNIFADGCFEPGNQGLTYHGIQAVQEMNRLGIIVDLSHVGERSALEAIERSTKPCIFSHSNAKGVTDSPRNATDEQIKLLASRGGVIGLSPHAFMSHKKKGVQPTLDDYLDHFEHVAALVGTDHIGIGSDVFESYSKFSWESSTKLLYDVPWVFETVFNSGFRYITDIKHVVGGLVARGFSDEDITNILGQNFLRIFQDVWRNDL